MDLTITHHIAAPLEVINAALGLRAQNLTQAIKVLDVVDAATYEAGNRLLIESHKALKDIEKAVEPIEREIRDMGKAVRQVKAGVCDPLELGKKAMQGKVAAYQKAEQAKADALRREAEEKARIEREAAEKERARLQAIADAEHAAEVAAAEAKAEAEAKELEAILGKPVEAEAVKVAPAPVIQAAPVAAPVAVAAPLPKAAVQTVSVPVLVVADAGALAAWLVANSRANLVEFKMREIKALHDAGIAVPGLVIEQREQTRMAGGRS
jgi:hypothetical protein